MSFQPAITSSRSLPSGMSLRKCNAATSLVQRLDVKDEGASEGEPKGVLEEEDEGAADAEGAARGVFTRYRRCSFFERCNGGEKAVGVLMLLLLLLCLCRALMDEVEGAGDW